MSRVGPVSRISPMVIFRSHCIDLAPAPGVEMTGQRAGAVATLNDAADSMSSGVNSFLSVCPPDHQQSTPTETADRLIELGAEGKGECPFEPCVR